MKSLFFFFFYFSVNTMNDCCFGTDTIDHCMNKEIFFFLFFNLSDGSLLSDTEKLCFFLLLIVKFILRRSYYEICFVLRQAYLLDLVSRHGPIYVTKQVGSECLCTRAHISLPFQKQKIYSFYFETFIFQEY